jgi:peptide/nickel transport system substrate-binding protein
MTDHQPEDDAGTHRLSRRDVLLQGAGAGALLAGTSFMGALTSTAEAAIAATPPRFSIPNGPEIYSKVIPKLPKGGRLSIAAPGLVPANLDPMSSAIVGPKAASYPAHDFLEYFDERGVRVLSLAESMKVISSTVLEYRLQPNVRFHNGEACTSQSVKDLFEWIQKPGNAPGVASLVAGVKVEVVNARTFRFVLPAPSAPFRDALTYIPLVPISAASRQASSPVGCGPYVFKDWTRGVSVTWNKNPSYWNKGAPPAAGLDFYTFSDPQAAVQFFDSRRADWLYNIPSSQMGAFQARARRGELKLTSELSQWYYLRFNPNMKPFDDVLVRQAVRLCVDRQAVNMAAEAGNGEAVYIPVNKNHPYYSKEFIYKRDVARAKQLMARAGHARGVSGGTMLVPLVGNTPAGSQVIQANLREIGIDVNLQVVDLPTYNVLRSRLPLIFSFSFFVQEIANLLNNSFISKAGSNYVGYSHQRTDYLLLSASKNYNETSRRKLYREAFKEIMVNQAVNLAIAGIRVTNAYRLNTNGDQYSPTNGFFFRYPITSIKR